MADINELVGQAVQYYDKAMAYQHAFKGDSVAHFMSQHAEIPVFCVTAYLAMVFYVPVLMKDREPIKFHHLFSLWNFLLAIFSICGSLAVVPMLVNQLTQKGWHASVCEAPRVWYYDGLSGFWVAAFILSKMPELVDTFFLVTQKKNVIFLHWYHHTTVMLYCWHAYIVHMSTGLWFAAMNFVVHSIMYSYYFFMNVSPFTRKLVKPTAKLITTMQLLQMVQGLIVTVASFYYMNSPQGCAVDAANSKMGLFMYFTYFVLFAYFFKQSYGKRGRKTRQSQEGDVCTSTVDHIRRGVPNEDGNGAAKKKQ